MLVSMEIMFTRTKMVTTPCGQDCYLINSPKSRNDRFESSETADQEAAQRHAQEIKNQEFQKVALLEEPRRDKAAR